MKKYKFDMQTSTITGFREKDHIILAHSLTDAVTKFIRKHDLEAPAYWDEPTYDRHIDLIFNNRYGFIQYQISW